MNMFLVVFGLLLLFVDILVLSLAVTPSFVLWHRHQEYIYIPRDALYGAWFVLIALDRILHVCAIACG